LTKILKGPEHACLRSVHENSLAYWRYFAKTSTVKLDETDELFLLELGLTRDQTPFCPNGVFKTNQKTENVDKKIEEVIDYYNSQNKSFWWWVYPSCKPSNLGEYLKKHNFDENDGTPLMAIELKDLIDDRPRPKGLTIKEVTDEDDMRVFGDLWCRGYPMPRPLADYFVDCVIDTGVESDVTKLYIGYLNGKPLSTSHLLLGAGVAGLYAVTVMPEARGRGLGTEMSLYPMRIAREMGYHIGVLEATQQGYGIYKRIGFKDYGTPKMYMLSSPEQQAFSEKAKEFIQTPRN